MFCYVWEYRVDADHLSEFLAGYGPEGEWASFFRQDPSYVRTELLRDREDSERFVTIDYWTSAEACLSFRERRREEFDAIDSRYDRITASETHLGDFDAQGGLNPLPHVSPPVSS